MSNQKSLDPFVGLCTAVSWPALGEWEFPFCGHMDLPKVGKSSLTLGPIREVSLPIQHMRQNWPWSKPNGPDILNPYENFKPYAHRVGRCLHQGMSRCRLQPRLVYSNVRVNGHTLFFTAWVARASGTTAKINKDHIGQRHGDHLRWETRISVKLEHKTE